MDREGQPCAADDDTWICRQPVWSADGKRLAHAHQPPGHLDDVYVNEIGTGLIRP